MGDAFFLRIYPQHSDFVNMATVIEMIKPSNWLMRLLSIEDQVSLTVEQDASLIPDRGLNEVASSSALQFPGMSQCPGT